MIQKPTILIVEDESAIREMLALHLSQSDFTVYEAGDHKEMQQQLAKQIPDLIVLDWMLPGLSGIEITRQLKKQAQTRNIPIIIVTAKAEEENKVTGFDTGADDYVVKPFSPRELTARIKAVLRRGVAYDTDGIIQSKELQIDPNNHLVSIAGTLVHLNPREYQLLLFFVTHKDRVYTRAQLLDHVWGVDAYIDERTVDVEIRRLRQMLKPYDYDKNIQTVRGHGYRYSEKIR